MQLTVKFPSLDFSQAPIVGLLFAAGWCPDCQATFPSLINVISAQPMNAARTVHVIYVSSDESEEAMLKFKPPLFGAVPFAELEERAGLKRYFRTCARKEMPSLGMTERDYGIPALILIESSTGRILKEAMEDTQLKPGSSVEEVLGSWRKLLDE